MLYIKKHKKIILPIFITIGFIVFAVLMQSNIMQVSAQVVPVTVTANYLNFGTVFPGEELKGTFQVIYSEEGEGVKYRIVQKRKLLPPDHPEYPDGGDPSMPGYYRNLCPSLTKTSEEGEGDIEEMAFVGQEGDLSDTWTVYFRVPAIFGYIAQDHSGGVISESGEYGCDISIDILLEPASICGTKFFDTDANQEFWGNDYALPDWTINLLEETGCTGGENCDNGWEIIGSEITGANGGYCFNDLQPGVYRLKEVLQPGWFPTIPANPDYFQITVFEGYNLNYIDFGNYSESL